MAQAVTRLYPGTKVAIGPSIENGFYYDFSFPKTADGKSPLTAEDLPRIEAEMRRIIDTRQDFVRVELSREDPQHVENIPEFQNFYLFGAYLRIFGVRTGLFASIPRPPCGGLRYFRCNPLRVPRHPRPLRIGTPQTP
jgi:hypothetical protein